MLDKEEERLGRGVSATRRLVSTATSEEQEAYKKEENHWRNIYGFHPVQTPMSTVDGFERNNKGEKERDASPRRHSRRQASL